MAIRATKSGRLTSQAMDRLNADLLGSAYQRNLDGVLAALQHGADIEAKHEPTGLTALHIAVGTNNLPLVRILVEDWQAPFGPDRFGRWPTIVAAECEVSGELCDYIVEQEAAYLERAEGAP